MSASNPKTPADGPAAIAIRNQALLALIAETGLRLAAIAKLRSGAALFSTPPTNFVANPVLLRWRRWAALAEEAAPPAPDGLDEPPLRQAKRSRRTTTRGKAPSKRGGAKT